MSPLIQIAAFVWREERAALWRGLLLSVAVLSAGGLLLGLSGWFITAAGVAGVAGIGIAFDVFRPSAGVRFLALGRTAARYGERVLTHDATLRVLARVRVRILERLSERSPDNLARLRSPALLNRVMSDVDALDGVAIRLVFPVIAGVVTLGLGAALLSWLASPLVAALVVGVLSMGGAATMAALGRKSVAPAARAEAARQALRSAAVEHLRARIALAFSGALGRSRQSLLKVDAELRRAELRLAELEAQAAAAVSLSGILAASGGLLLGGALALRGDITTAQAAIGVFSALALVEVIAPAQRAVAEIGRIRNAASRVAPMLGATPAPDTVVTANAAPARSETALLELRNLTFAAPGSAIPLTAPVTLSVRAGEMAALTGRSGAGKTTLLSIIAGLATPRAGSITIAGRSSDTLEEADLRATLGYMPQRSRFISGTIRDNLALAAPDATDADMAEVLAALGLNEALAARGGLDMPLGEGGSGLSGGESRRLALARVLLRRPRILLLDEPTESLDADNATRVLSAIKRLLPTATVLIATHKPEEQAACDIVCDLNGKN